MQPNVRMRKCKNNIMFNFTPPHCEYVVNDGIKGNSNAIGGAHGSCVSPICYYERTHVQAHAINKMENYDISS
jgi:hypothetical protein